MREERIIVSLTILLLTFTRFSSEGQNLPEEAQHYFNEIRRGVFLSIPAVLLSQEYENSTLHLLQPLLRDSTGNVRARASEITYLLSSRSDNARVRHQGVNMLLQTGVDPDPGIARIALAFLKEFDKQDFTLEAKDSLRKLVKIEGTQLAQLIKLAGFLELRDLIPEIRPWAQPGNPTPVRWAAILSLARMGESEAISDIMKRVEKVPVNDDLVYEVFPDLIYTRQREPIAYVVEALQSDEKSCMSADAEREMPILCGYRIIEQLAPVIAGYPLQLDDTGDIKAEDYTLALESVREWFQSNPSYTILNHRY